MPPTRTTAGLVGVAVAVGAGILAATGLGAVAAFLGVVAFVGPECPGYDDEGLTAAPGSVYAALLCGGVGEVPGAVVTTTVAGLVLAVVVAVALARRRAADAVAVTVPTGVGLAAPLVVLALLHGALPKDCPDGADGTATCERNAELR